MTTAIVISLVGLIIVIAVHIAVIARWSGRIDGYMVSMEGRMAKAETEILRLRDARHMADGTLQRHEGMLREFERRGGVPRRTTDCPIVESGE